MLLFVSSLITAQQSYGKEYIVKLKTESYSKLFNFTKSHKIKSLTVHDFVNSLNLAKIEAAVDNPTSLKEYLNADYVVENIQFHTFSDERRSEQWALDIVNAESAWGISQGDHSIVVAVVDTGVDISHEDLAKNVWFNPAEIAGNGVDDDGNGYVDDVNGWDFHGNDNDPTDETGSVNPGHGTHCAGIIGAECNNTVGICGIAPKVSIMPVRFLGKDGSGDLFASVKAVSYAADNGAHIISASWGAVVPESAAQPIVDAIKKAEEKGVIFIAAASNEGKSNDTTSVYPANAQTPNMISVAGSNPNDQKPVWSNYGRKVDIAAPGENILSTIPGGYKALSGTSMATPMVSGLVALMKSLDNDLTGAQARSILQSTGVDVDIETASKKRIDAHKALESVFNKTLTVVPATRTLKPGESYTFAAWGGESPYKFNSLNPEIGTIEESGEFAAIKEGDVTIEVVDANNNIAKSVSIRISEGAGNGGGSGECPLQNPLLCTISCIISPNLPWCDGSSGLPGLPGLPELPGLPGLPELPGLPGLPELPGLPGLP